MAGPEGGQKNKMEGCASKNSPRSDDAPEEQENGDEIQDLSRLMMSATRLVQTAAESQNVAELAHHYMEEALRRASGVLDCSRMVLQASCLFGNRLLDQKERAGYRAQLQGNPGLSASYGALLGALHNAEDVLSHVKTQSDGSRPRGKSPGAGTQHTEKVDDTSRSHSVTDKTSHHKQLETVRIEEQMGGAFVIQRRRSPSPGADGVSPLLSEEELNIFKPSAQSPSCKGSARFTNKILHRERSQDGSDSDTTERTDRP